MEERGERRINETQGLLHAPMNEKALWESSVDREHRSVWWGGRVKGESHRGAMSAAFKNTSA
jgi:hypothetical protein